MSTEPKQVGKRSNTGHGKSDQCEPTILYKIINHSIQRHIRKIIYSDHTRELALVCRDGSTYSNQKNHTEISKLQIKTYDYLS